MEEEEVPPQHAGDYNKGNQNHQQVDDRLPTFVERFRDYLEQTPLRKLLNYQEQTHHLYRTDTTHRLCRENLNNRTQIHQDVQTHQGLLFVPKNKQIHQIVQHEQTHKGHI